MRPQGQAGAFINRFRPENNPSPEQGSLPLGLASVCSELACSPKHGKGFLSDDHLCEFTITFFPVSPSLETCINKKMEHFQDVIDEGFPIVLYDRNLKDLECDKVMIKDHKATFNAVEHLKNTGCKNIAFISTHKKLARKTTLITF